MNSVGQPVCGLVTGRIIVLEVHDTTMVTQHDGTSLRLNLVTVQIVGSVARLVGIVNVPVVSGLSKIGTPI
jgi:hypothetical protein